MTKFGVSDTVRVWFVGEIIAVEKKGDDIVYTVRDGKVDELGNQTLCYNVKGGYLCKEYGAED
jgi:hypothetical protein